MSPISFFFLFNTLSTGTIYTVVGRVSNKKQPCVYGFIRLEFLFSPKLLLEKLQLQGMVSELLVSPFQLGAGTCTVFRIFFHMRLLLAESREMLYLHRETSGNSDFLQYQLLDLGVGLEASGPGGTVSLE